MTQSKSQALYKRAEKLIPGGVNSPVRAFKPYPFFVSHASGSKLRDVDGKTYIDYCMAYGPLILGHSHPEVIEVVKEQLAKGTMYGAPTESEVELAELVTRLVPCMEMMRLVNTGTEATMHALRVARAYTGREKIVMFEGCYHGAHDYVLMRAGSEVATFGVPSSLGVPKETARNTIVLPFNNLEALEKTVEENRGEIAAVIVEPVMGNVGVVLPKRGYLQGTRRITREEGIVLIFDEVITGFRLALGGAQEYFGVIPDMATLGKIMGGGFPIGAFGERRDIMELLSPIGKVYQAGTFSGNPISVTAGLATLKVLSREKKGLYRRLASMGEEVGKGLKDIVTDTETAVQVNGLASMFQIFFTDQPVVDYTSAETSDTNRFMRYQSRLMERGVFIPPSQFETCFLSIAHTENDISKTLETAHSALKSL